MKLSEFMEKRYGIEMLPDNPVYAMAYVPFQAAKAKLFSPHKGSPPGRRYRALTKPFWVSRYGGRAD